MADATDGPDYSVQIEKACRLYAGFGYAPERIAAQLIRSGYPASLVRARFPSLAADASPDVAASQVLARTERHAPPAPNVGALLPALTAAPPVADIPAGAPAALSSGISFQYVPLIQCSFPHADPGDAATFTRRNGWLELTLSATRRDTGLPYGVPARLLTIYCASEAVRTRSPEIYLGRTVHEFLRCLDVPITRGERGSLRVYANQLLRLIHCAVSIDENIRDAVGRSGLHIRQVSTGAIRQLRKSPMDLDVYAWLVHRLFNLSRSNTVTWAQLSGQFGHGYAEPRKFRHFFLDSLKRVLAVYPEANVKPAEVGLVLAPSRPHVPRDHRALTR
jgi:hypothetical protein